MPSPPTSTPWVPLWPLQPDPEPIIVDLVNPRTASLTGNAYQDVLALTAHDLGHWHFVKDVEGRIYGRVNCANPRQSAQLALDLAWNATTGVSRMQASWARIADGASLNPASFPNSGTFDITVPATAYLRKVVAFSLGTVAAGDLILIEIKHDGAHVNDTVNADTLLLGATLIGY